MKVLQVSVESRRQVTQHRVAHCRRRVSLGIRNDDRLCKQLEFVLLLFVQNQVPDAEPECDPASATAARSLWLDRVAASGELTIEVQDYIPFGA